MADKKTIAGGAAGVAAVAIVALKLLTPGTDPSLPPKPGLVPGEFSDQIKWKAESPQRMPHKYKAAVFAYNGIPWEQRSNYVIVFLVPPEVGGELSSSNLYPIPLKYAQAKKDADAAMVARCIADIQTNNARLINQHRSGFAKNWVAEHKKYAGK